MLQHNKKTVRWTVFLYLRNVVISEYRSQRGVLYSGVHPLVPVSYTHLAQKKRRPKVIHVALGLFLLHERA